MKKISLLMLILAVFSASANATYIYEYFEKIEPLLKENKFDEANTEFKELSSKIRNHAVKGNTVGIIYEKTVKWLKANNKIRLFLVRVNESPGSYEANGNYGISTKNCQGNNCEYYHHSMINSGLPKTLPFSTKFVEYINAYHKETYELFSSSNSKLNQISENKRKREADTREAERNLKKENARLQREKETLARKTKEKEKQAAIASEEARIDQLAKTAGYSGYANVNLIQMIYKTQKEGGLEKYINKVVGCHNLQKNPCDKWYPKLKAIQILDNGVLYSFSEYSSGEYVSFSVFSDKEVGKIYQEGQSFENTLHVFKGMLSYTTVSGASKTVPSFVKVNIGE
jgi:hypothetical protein